MPFAGLLLYLLPLLFQDASSSRPGPSFSGRDAAIEAAACLRDRVRSLESDLKQSNGRADVWKKKAELAIENQNFLMGELEKLNAQLRRKFLLRAP